LAGHSDDFGILVERYLPMAHAVACGNLHNPADADDVAQESFIAAFQKLDTLRAPQRFAPWLVSIVRNTALCWRRRQRRESPLKEHLVAEQAVEQSPMEQAEMRRMLQQTLATLPPEPREILFLHYYAGKSLREIADLQSISRDAAAKRLQRAREALGTEFLKLVQGDALAPEHARKSAKAIMAAILAAPVAWQAAPAYAATGLLTLGAVKWMVLSTVLAGTAAIACVAAAPYVSALHQLFQAPPQTAITVPAAKSAMNEVAQAQPVPETPLPPSTGTLTGPGEIQNVLVDLRDEPVGGAVVTAELVTWKPMELPPKETQRWTTRSDANGGFVLKDLPLGNYSVTAMSGSMGGAHDVTVRRDHTSRPRDIKMYPIMPCSGAIHDQDGAPVAGAVIYPVSHSMFPEEEFEHLTIAGIRGQSGEDGRFQLQGLIPGGWKFFVVAPDRPAFYTDYIPVYGGGFDIVASKAGSVSGHVVSASDGQPFAKLRIALHAGARQYIPSADSDKVERSERIRNEVETDQDGAFKLAGLGSGDYQVTVMDAALILADPKATVNVPPDAENSEAVIRVAPGGSITGKVTNKQSGEGIPGIPIYAYGGNLTESKEVKTGMAGDYILSGLPAGNCEVQLSGGEIMGQFVEEYELRRREVNVTAGQTTENIDFTLTPGLPVQGIVLDAQNQPVAKAEISAYTRQGDESHGPNAYDNTTADENGIFHLFHLKGNSEITIRANGKELRSKPFTAHLGDKGLQDVVIRLDVTASGSIEGTVLNASGKPLYPASVSASEIPQEAASPSPMGIDTFGGSGDTEPSGHFLVKELPAGQYRLSVQERRNRVFYTGMGLDDPENIVQVAEGQAVKGVTLHYGQQGSLSIAGHVVAPDGKSVVMAALALAENQKVATAGLNGAFEFTGLSEGNFTLFAVAPGSSPVRVEHVAAGTRGLEVKLEPTAVLTGTVVDAATGSPIPNFNVAYNCTLDVSLDVNASALSGKRTVSDENGRFPIEGLATLPLRASITADECVPWVNTFDHLEGGQENDIAVQLQRGARIEGTVRNENGEPVVSAAILYEKHEEPGNPAPGANSSEGQRLLTDNKGGFTIQGAVPEQKLNLVAQHQEYASERFSVTPHIGKTVRADVVLSQGGTLKVHATLDGQPLQEFRVSVTPPILASTDAQRYSYYQGNTIVVRENMIETTQNGEFEFTKAQPGEVTVTVTANTELSEGAFHRVASSVKAQIVSGKVTEVTAPLHQGAGVIE
jgi:RNA polymerase sigma factor (sigma-70 family)